MSDAGFFGDFSVYGLKDMISKRSHIYLYLKDDFPVCSMMIIPESTNVEENKENENVVDYGPMMVHPDYVGQGLQYQMLEKLDVICKNLSYNYAVITVHPDNVYSIKKY